MRKLVPIAVALAAAGALSLRAQQPPPQPQPDDVDVRPIPPPPRPLPGEAATARVTRFSFIAYGDTRSRGPSASGEPVEDGLILQREHGRVVDAMIKATRRLASTRFPIRFVVSSGDAVLYGPNGTMWNVSYVPLVERLTRALPHLQFVYALSTRARELLSPRRSHLRR